MNIVDQGVLDLVFVWVVWVAVISSTQFLIHLNWGSTLNDMQVWKQLVRLVRYIQALTVLTAVIATLVLLFSTASVWWAIGDGVLACVVVHAVLRRLHVV